MEYAQEIKAFEKDILERFKKNNVGKITDTFKAIEDLRCTLSDVVCCNQRLYNLEEFAIEVEELEKTTKLLGDPFIVMDFDGENLKMVQYNERRPNRGLQILKSGTVFRNDNFSGNFGPVHTVNDEFANILSSKIFALKRDREFRKELQKYVEKKKK